MQKKEGKIKRRREQFGVKIFINSYTFFTIFTRRCKFFSYYLSLLVPNNIIFFSFIFNNNNYYYYR